MGADLTNGFFTLAGAVLGSIITGALAWYIGRQNRRRSELTVLRGTAVRLIEVQPNDLSVVELRVRGKPVPTVYTQDIRIVNTGTEFVRDGRIDIRVSDDAQLLSADIVDCPSDAAGEPAAHAETHKLGARLSFGYINPNERLLLRILLERPIDVVPTFRQEGVSFVVRDHFESTMPELLDEALSLSFSVPSLVRFAVSLLVPRSRRFLDRG